MSEVRVTGIPGAITGKALGEVLRLLGLPETTESLSMDPYSVSASVVTEDGVKFTFSIPVTWGGEE